jgi:hypothetical protein
MCKIGNQLCSQAAQKKSAASNFVNHSKTNHAKTNILHGGRYLHASKSSKWQRIKMPGLVSVFIHFNQGNGQFNFGLYYLAFSGVGQPEH